MSRPLRIEYHDAWYHVMNRGRRTEKIFLDKTDHTIFLELLIESAEMWNVRIVAYCIMPNHYHLLLQTPDANLSRFMRHIDGVYTQRFNRSHQCDGQLFRGRYKSIILDADSYLLQLVRYIHRNPLQAGLVNKLEAYKWSSHKGYISDEKKWRWLHKGFILSMLTRDKAKQRRVYRQFISKEDPEEIRLIFNEATNVAIYLTRQLRGDKLGELCKEFHMKRCSSASSAIERLKIQMSKDKKLKKRLEKLRLMLVNSQA